MVISDLYDIMKIILDTETALQIDGADYAEKDFDIIMNNVYSRITRQYQIDLHETKLTDNSLYSGPTRASATLLLENITALHSKLSGYAQIILYSNDILIRPANFNYMGYSKDSFDTAFAVIMRKSRIETCTNTMSAFEHKIGSINNCTEKRLIVIMLVCYRLGLYELVAIIANIFYLGDKL